MAHSQKTLVDLQDEFKENYGTFDVNIQNGTASELTIALDKCLINEPSIDSGGAVLTETIPFTVVAADDISSSTKMLGITIA